MSRDIPRKQWGNSWEEMREIPLKPPRKFLERDVKISTSIADVARKL